MPTYPVSQSRAISHVEWSLTYVWEVATLSWVPCVQPSPSGVAQDVNVLNFPATQPVSVATLPLPANASKETGGNLEASVTQLAGIVDLLTAVMSGIGVSGLANALAVQGATGGVPLTVTGINQLTPVSGSVSSSGNNTLITPTSGKKLRVYYLAYNPSAAVECAFRFGAAGALFLRNNLTQGGSVVAKDYGDGKYIQGATNEALVLNLSGAVATIWNVNYIEVD